MDKEGKKRNQMEPLKPQAGGRLFWSEHWSPHVRVLNNQHLFNIHVSHLQERNFTKESWKTGRETAWEVSTFLFY